MSRSSGISRPSAAPRAHSRLAEVVCVVLFITVMAVANLVIATFGPWLLPVTAFVSVGISMVARDYLHDVWSGQPGGFWLRMFSMVVAAGALAWLVDANAGLVAIASALALTGSAIVDTAAFAWLIRSRWLIRSNGSNIFGSLADSIIFPLVAFGVAGVGGWQAFILLVLAQSATKAAGGLFWSLVIRWTLNPDKRRAQRAAMRERLEAEHAEQAEAAA